MQSLNIVYRGPADEVVSALEALGQKVGATLLPREGGIDNLLRFQILFQETETQTRDAVEALLTGTRFEVDLFIGEEAFQKHASAIHDRVGVFAWGDDV